MNPHKFANIIYVIVMSILAAAALAIAVTTICTISHLITMEETIQTHSSRLDSIEATLGELERSTVDLQQSLADLSYTVDRLVIYVDMLQDEWVQSFNDRLSAPFIICPCLD